MKELIIFELDETESNWWSKKIKELRDKIVLKPKEYLDKAENIFPLAEKIKEGKIDEAMRDIRETAWEIYLKDELEFHKRAVACLVAERQLPRDILANILDSGVLDKSDELSQDELLHRVGELVGDYAGRIMPYIYALSLSTTNSRRSRAGKTFESVIEKVMECLDIPYDNQSGLGTSFYRDNNLTKMVDAIVPGKEAYSISRSNCSILTAKTTLRERWQEVIEEINRTNMPHMFLLTLDDQITSNVLETLSNYNVTIVLYESVKESQYSNFNNVLGFKTFFEKELKHTLNYWRERDFDV